MQLKRKLQSRLYYQRKALLRRNTPAPWQSSSSSSLQFSASSQFIFFYRLNSIIFQRVQLQVDIHLFIHSSFHSIIHAFIHPFIHFFFYSFIHLFIHSFSFRLIVHLFIFLFNHLFIHFLFIYSFFHYLFIYPFNYYYLLVFLGATIGLFMKLLPEAETKRIESFSPTAFFLVLLPPIIFESGYNLHKGKDIILIKVGI